ERSRKPGADVARQRRGRVLLQSRHQRDALRRGPGPRARDALRARLAGERRHRLRRRLLAHGREAGRDPAPLRPRPRQRTRRIARRPPRPQRHRQRGGRPGHLPSALRRAAHRRHRGLGPRRLRLGADLHEVGARRGRRRRRRAGGAHGARTGRHPGPAFGLLLERGRCGRARLAGAGRPAGRPDRGPRRRARPAREEERADPPRRPRPARRGAALRQPDRRRHRRPADGGGLERPHPARARPAAAGARALSRAAGHRGPEVGGAPDRGERQGAHRLLRLPGHAIQALPGDGVRPRPDPLRAGRRSGVAGAVGGAGRAGRPDAGPRPAAGDAPRRLLARRPRPLRRRLDARRRHRGGRGRDLRPRLLSPHPRRPAARLAPELRRRHRLRPAGCDGRRHRRRRRAPGDRPPGGRQRHVHGASPLDPGAGAAAGDDPAAVQPQVPDLARRVRECRGQPRADGPRHDGPRQPRHRLGQDGQQHGGGGGAGRHPRTLRRSDVASLVTAGAVSHRAADL
ncbi:MAG: Thiamine pyrophosphate-requiring enzymes, partial [uncultured Acetobacteraceae bacterium]